MLRVYRDPAYPGLYIDGIARVFPSGSLRATVDPNGLLWIFLGSTQNALVTIQWNQLADINGNGFADQATALAYMTATFGPLPKITVPVTADGALDIPVVSEDVEVFVNGLQALPSEYTVAAGVLHIPLALNLRAGDTVLVVQE